MGKAKAAALELQRLSELNLKYCNPPCEVSDLHPELVDRIILAQKMCGEQFIVTSGYRSQVYERSKGRKGSSSHAKIPGLAVDISAVNSHLRFKVVAALLYAGFPRLGIGKTFIHADIDETKPHPIIFHYYDPQET